MSESNLDSDFSRFKRVSIEMKFPDESLVLAEDDMIPLCQMCTKSRLTCDNLSIKESTIILEGPILPEQVGPGIMTCYGDDKKLIGHWLFMKINAVEAGIITSEDQIPIPYVCKWFNPKDPG